MRDETQFENAVDRWVAARLANPMTWNSLVYSLPSVYPEVALNSAKRLSLLNRISFPPTKLSGSFAPCFALDLWFEERVLTPHALDSTWWFGDSALETLRERIESLTVPGDNVLLLGAPTLLHYAMERSGDRFFLLLDREPVKAQKEGSGCVTADLLTEQPSVGRMDLIVADPPWYSRETRAFLVTAIRNARTGSKVLLSVPPVGTRPGVEREWQELLLWAGGIGLHLLTYETGVLPYVSPLFERNALRAAHVETYPEQWRRGDLATFEWDGTSEGLDALVPATAMEEWSEVTFGRVRLRLRTAQYTDWETPLLKEVVPGGVLPSVSRRDHRLASVAAWTSGNRVFECEGAYILGIIARALAEGRCAVTAVASLAGLKLCAKQRADIEEAVIVLADVVAVEEQEITDWGKRLNDDVVEFPSHQS
jgi:hypothetical protein